MILRPVRHTDFDRAASAVKDRRLNTSVLVFVLILLLGTGPLEPVFCASSTGSLQGQITDHFGALIPGITVTVTNADTGDIVGEAMSGREGIFLLTGLPPGNYSVRVAPLFPFGETDDKIEVDADQVANMKLVLGRGCSRSTDTGGLQEGFLAEAVRLAFLESLGKLGVPHSKGQPVLVSKANIKPAWLSILPDTDIKLIPEGSIPLADSSGRPAKYIRVSDIRTSSGCASVSIGFVSPPGVLPPEQATGDTGFTLEFRKVGEKWLKRTVLEVIS